MEMKCIEHLPKEGRFVLHGDADDAALIYRRVDEGTLDFEHTYVPPELRGGGLGGRLVREGLEWAKREGYWVIPSCPFVAEFIERHPEYRELEQSR